jgi:hypothetical protein
MEMNHAGDPELFRFAQMLKAVSIGEPRIVVEEETIPAGNSARIVLKIDTGADMVIESFVTIIDDIPLHALATCLLDVTHMTATTETTQSEINLIAGSGNLLAVLGADGAFNNREGDLRQAIQIRRGSEVAITILNRDGDDHKITVAGHGYLVRG